MLIRSSEMAFRRHHSSCLFPGIAWVSVSIVVGLSYAKAHALTGVWTAVALVVAAVTVALAFAVISVTLGLLLMRALPGRSAKRKDSGPGAG
jgi:hypothetical protein